MEPVIWTVILIAMLAVEAVTVSLTTIWFCGGAIPALIIAFCGGPLWPQVAVFCVVSALLLILTRPLAKKYLNTKSVKTNADSLVGKQAIVVEEIDNLHSTGAVQINGQYWTARITEQFFKNHKYNAGNYIVPVNSVVTIREINGVKLMIEPDASPEASVPEEKGE